MDTNNRVVIALSLNIPPCKLFWWFWRLQLWATEDWRLHHDNMPTHASHLLQRFLAKHQITQVAQAPYSSDLRLMPFPKTTITFGREEISDHQWDSGKCDRAADGNWENCVRSQGACFEGTKVSLSYVQCFLCLLQLNVSIFHITWLVTFWTDLVY